MSGDKNSSGPQDGRAEAGRSVARSGENRVGVRAAAKKLLADMDAGFAETETVGAPEAPSVLQSMDDLRAELKHEAELAEAVAVAAPGDVVFARAAWDWSPDQCRQAQKHLSELVPEGVSVVLVPNGVEFRPLFIVGEFSPEAQKRWEAKIAAAGPGAITPTAAPPRFYDSLRTVLRRPDVGEAIAKGLCAHNGGDWANATEAGRNAFRGDARNLIDQALE